MSDTHAVISAFLDDEPFDPVALADALSDPAGRALLIDLLALRHIVQPEEASASVALLSPGGDSLGGHCSRPLRCSSHSQEAIS